MPVPYHLFLYSFAQSLCTRDCASYWDREMKDKTMFSGSSQELEQSDKLKVRYDVQRVLTDCWVLWAYPSVGGVEEDSQKK